MTVLAGMAVGVLVLTAATVASELQLRKLKREKFERDLAAINYQLRIEADPTKRLSLLIERNELIRKGV